MILSESANRNGDRVNTTFDKDFQPLATYIQVKNSNETYTSVVTTRSNPDGSTSQNLQIISKR
jgi:hypothetical protein